MKIFINKRRPPIVRMKDKGHIHLARKLIPFLYSQFYFRYFFRKMASTIYNEHNIFKKVQG